MVDKSGLKFVGWLFGSATAVVMIIALLLVTHAGASGSWEAPHPAAVTLP